MQKIHSIINEYYEVEAFTSVKYKSMFDYSFMLMVLYLDDYVICILYFV